MTLTTLTDSDYRPLPGFDEPVQPINPRYLPKAGDVCFCCQQLLGSAVSVLGEDLFMCIPCDRELRQRRFVWLKSEAALDAGVQP